jgi:two-component sensor histidine kinase
MGEEWLRLGLTENEGRGSTPGHKEGFGLRLVNRSVEYEPAGKAELTLDATGFRCAIELPLRDGGAGPEAAAESNGGSDAG